jgi:xanthine dehydrogenase accessory factor
MAEGEAITRTFEGGWPAWPSYALVDDLLPVLEAWTRQGRRYALATLIDVVGSSPRPVGSEMAIADDGECAGYVSGGCVEAAVAAEALAVLADGKPRVLDYGAGSPVLDVQLSCGGRIRILVRAVPDAQAYVSTLRAARNERRTLVSVTDCETGSTQFSAAEGESAARAGIEQNPRFYRHLHRPPLRLIVVGGDPIVLALLRLAPMFGVDTVLLRPRGPESYPDDLPAPLLYDRRSLETSLAAITLDSRTAVYTLSHDADADHSLLMWALRSEAYCVGALGSRSKAKLRLERLRANGIDEAALSRLHTPAGIDIGAKTPQEIALSILGQVIAERPA